MTTISLFADIDEITLDGSHIATHYDNRCRVSYELRELLRSGRRRDYLELALGVSDIAGNYSASDHHLGEPILAYNSEEALFRLAQSLADESLTTQQMLRLIYEANLSHLKIGVGSEMACMLQPHKFWVGNVRTIWCHLLVRHNCDQDSVNVELQAYRDHDNNSEMAYRLWREIYPRMRNDLHTLASWVNEQSAVTPAEQPDYLWVDAICSELFEVAAD